MGKKFFFIYPWPRKHPPQMGNCELSKFRSETRWQHRLTSKVRKLVEMHLWHWFAGSCRISALRAAKFIFPWFSMGTIGENLVFPHTNVKEFPNYPHFELSAVWHTVASCKNRTRLQPPSACSFILLRSRGVLYCVYTPITSMDLVAGDPSQNFFPFSGRWQFI